MQSFEKLGVPGKLVEHLLSLGYDRPSAFQEDAIPVIARGTHIVGVTSSGSGKTLAYAVGIAGRLDAKRPVPQALILRPTDDAAADTAEKLFELIRPSGLQTGLLGSERTSAKSSGAQIAVASPTAALAALESSRIKLSDLQALVIDGASAISELGGDEALDTITSLVPKDAQRIVLTAALTTAVENWVERHARRARRVIDIPADVEQLGGARAEFFATPSHRRLVTLIELISGAGPRARVVVHCRNQRDAADLRERLAVRGFEPDGKLLEFSVGEPSEAGGTSLCWGVPLDVSRLAPILKGSGSVHVLLEPKELPHLKRLAGALGVKLTARRAPADEAARDSASRTRELLKQAAAERDLEPYILLLEPLLEEFTPIQIAAAAASLLRQSTPDEPHSALPAWTRLYFGVGRRDSVRPADIVGAITGEASLAADQIGRIEIRENFSLVEIGAPLADRVIKSLAAATIRGRPAHVRVYRE